MKHALHLTSLPEGWKGHLMMEAPLHTDRMKVMAESGFHRIAREQKELSKEDRVEKLFTEQFPLLLKVYEIAKPLIKEVCIDGPNGESIKDMEGFERHWATESAFQEVAAAYLGGFGPGKTKGQS